MDVIIHNPDLEYLVYLLIFTSKGSYPRMRLWKNNVIVINNNQIPVKQKIEGEYTDVEEIKFFDYYIYLISSTEFKINREEYVVIDGEIRKREGQIRLIRERYRS